MKYAITGMYRSGTTLCFNILSKLLEETTGKSIASIQTGVKIGDYEIHKFHEQSSDLNFDQYKTIYSYRDILDCLSSFIVKYNTTFEEFNVHNKSSVEFVKWMIDMDTKVKKKSGYAEICYEECILNVNELIENIALFYQINIPESFNREQFKINNVKSVTDKREKHSVIDQYHPRHVYNGEIGRWKSFFTEEQKEIIFTQTDYINWKYQRYEEFFT